MKEFPILFSTPMVQAILEGRKTQTRRIIKPQPNSHDDDNFPWLIEEGCVFIPIKCPYGHPGDLLWVKETFALSSTRWRYKADGDWTFEEKEMGEDAKWKSSRFMPKAAARILLQVEEIRVQRLIDITEEDAIAEGIEPVILHEIKSWKRYDGYEIVTSDPVVSFWSLWASINGEESWHSNPWLWVIAFKVISTTGKPNLES